MSLISREGRLSVKPCAFVPTLGDLPAINRAVPSVSNVSSRSASRGIGAGISLIEGCIVTKSIKYTHQLCHFVSAVHTEDPGPILDLIERMSIIPTANFSLGDPCNLAYFESFVHTALDLYGFIALTPSASTLKTLIKMLKLDNDKRQSQIDEEGIADRRSLNFSISSFTNPEYELVVIYPEHFLPNRSMLTVYNRDTGAYVNYVASRDRRLRTSSDIHGAHLPAFRHEHQARTPRNRLNVFLVALNAEIRFRRYFQELPLNSENSPLPADVTALMRSCMELIDLLYWNPEARQGSQGRAILDERVLVAPRNPVRAALPKPARMIERSSNEDTQMGGPASTGTFSQRRDWLDNATAEQRRAYGTMLMTREDDGYNPASLENLNDLIPNVEIGSLEEL